MGIVARQGIKYSIISYLSFLLGTFSTIFIYPTNTQFLGQLRFIQPAAELIYPFVVFGLSFANIRFHQKFKVQNQQIDFLEFSVKFIFCNFIFSLLIYLILAYTIPLVRDTNYWKMRYYIMPTVLILALTQLFARYISNFKRVAITGIFENFFPKLGSLIAFIFCVYLGISHKISLYIFILFFAFGLIGIIYYFFHLNKDKKSGTLSILKDKEFKSELFYFCLFAVLGNLGNQLALKIDNIMIAELIDYKQNGVYSILISIVGFLSVPLLGVFAISGPIIVEKLETHKWEELREFYQKISRFLFLFGTILLSCIFSGMDYLFHLMKNGQDLINAKSVVYILGFATLFDLATGFNSQIINYSKYYRFNIYAMLLLAVLTIISNWIFIVHFHLGIEGVSLATAISLTIFNIVKVIFNYKKFGIQPFTKIFIPILLTGVVSVLIAYTVPDFTNNLCNLILKPSIVLCIFFISNFGFKFIPLQQIFKTNFKNFLTGK
ncbi:lipopolysaccharide biosynthesis protein [Apibacter adventoris]|uniref:lipopolysaccharide biosynthesis protein n=1 Tax=Apibacter adventoris TaxID=1679466 RepID=UPI000CF6B643|nr:polysaccharide biosynthesis C-terminal domain-containing protein [Apibacter adventoris]PQL93529.1 polysaccharide biosynthesis protein [Apibacter adventoris]